MTGGPLLEMLREADPSPVRPVKDSALFHTIVAVPGDPRLAGPARRRPRRRRGRYLGALVTVIGLTVGTAWGASGESPLAIFTANPQEDGTTESSGSPWHQSVIPSSVRPVGAVTIPGVGRAVFWYARTRQNGWCSAIRLPGGGWAGTDTNPLDAGGAVPGCQPTRRQINAAGGAHPVYFIDGFDYDEVDLDARADGHGFWRIYFGEVTGKTPPVRVIDRASGRQAPVEEDHLFVLAVRDRRPQKISRLHLVAIGQGGRIVAHTGVPGD